MSFTQLRPPSPLHMTIRREEWPLARPFIISRSTMVTAWPLVVELESGGVIGRGECEAHESDLVEVEKAQRALESLRPVIEAGGFTRDKLQQLLPACPIRNALDCAFWDLEAKLSDIPVWQRAGLREPAILTTVYTISADTPEAMAEQTATVRTRSILKIKLKGAGDIERVRAVREAAPDTTLIVDANEAWTFGQLEAFAPALRELGVQLIEQPLPRGADAALAGYASPVPLCADETCRDVPTLADVIGKYQFINIKLDKTGGLTEAVKLLRAAQSQGLRIMVGCMVGTSLAMAPAALIASEAEFVDLDGPLLLARDREPGLPYRGSLILPQSAGVWGA